MLVGKTSHEHNKKDFVALAFLKAHEQMPDRLVSRRRQQRRRTPPPNRRCPVLNQIGLIMRGTQSRTNKTVMWE